jgi:hypothetical protein
METEEALHPTGITPRTVRTFATLPEAIDFIVQCLENNGVIKLLAEIQGVSVQVGRTKALVDRYKSAFAQMCVLHAEQDLRQVYADSSFPVDGDHYHLSGYLTQRADLDLYFVKVEEGWALERIDYL